MLGIIAGLLGMAIGSFLNVVIDRLPEGQSLAFPPSHCPACKKRLAAKDLIPIFSYIAVRGRCRYCNSPIPVRLLWVEVISTGAFVFLWWLYGFTLEFAVLAFYYCLLMVIFMIDLERRLVLNKIVYPALPAALLIASLTGPGFVNSLIGGAVGFAALLIIALIFRGGMGFGDVKLVALMGLMTGFPNIIVAIFLGIVGGGLAAIFLVLFRIKGRKETIPFAPFLCTAAMVTLIWGDALIHWYLSLAAA